MSAVQPQSEFQKKLNGERSENATQQLQGRESAHVFVGLPTQESSDPIELLQRVQSNFLYLRTKLAAVSPEIRDAVMLDSRIMHGNPVFSGTRIPLYRILEEIAGGATIEEIVDGYPSLSIQKVQTGLDFAASLLRIYDD